MSDSQKSKISISNFMTTNIKSIQAGASVKYATQMMYENHIQSLLVEEKGNIVGIITFADIAVAFSIYDKKSTSEISEIMSSPVVSVTSDSSILNAMELMLEKKIHKLPVIDDGKILGIITTTDLMALFSVLNEEQFYDIFRRHISKI